jgi:hypothetical protein
MIRSSDSDTGFVLRGLPPALTAVLVLVVACNSGATSPVAPQTPNSPDGAFIEYVDPGRRFTFRYPAFFGMVSTGTNNGFGNRVSALRFSIFSAAGIGGEAVVTQGRLTLDIQAAGGLYDSIVREALPASVLVAVDDLLPPLTLKTICDALAREDHIDVNATQLRGLTAPQRDALRQADRMGNIGPRLLECVIDGATVTFRKEAAVTEGGPVRQVFGAVRFLDTPYSSFQVVQARPTAVDSTTVTAVTQVVASWQPTGVNP